MAKDLVGSVTDKINADFRKLNARLQALSQQTLDALEEKLQIHGLELDDDSYIGFRDAQRVKTASLVLEGEVRVIDFNSPFLTEAQVKEILQNHGLFGSLRYQSGVWILSF